MTDRLIMWAALGATAAYLLDIIVHLGFGAWPDHTGIVVIEAGAAFWALGLAGVMFYMRRMIKGPAVHGGGGRAPGGISARRGSGGEK